MSVMLTKPHPRRVHLLYHHCFVAQPYFFPLSNGLRIRFTEEEQHCILFKKYYNFTHQFSCHVLLRQIASLL
jgi:hypothetical protein